MGARGWEERTLTVLHPMSQVTFYSLSGVMSPLFEGHSFIFPIKDKTVNPPKFLSRSPKPSSSENDWLEMGSVKKSLGANTIARLGLNPTHQCPYQKRRFRCSWRKAWVTQGEGGCPH